jgi:S1-C subfamily serine protease
LTNFCQVRSIAAILLAALCLSSGTARAQTAPPPPAMPPASTSSAPADTATPLSSMAERVFAEARPRLLQIRTLVAAAGRQSSIGSGFLVSADGLAITNYHVVSQYALEPATYRLEYTAVDGSRGAVKVLAIDLANDLALIRIGTQNQPFFQFDERALASALPKGERLYSMGNPLDLGFTIVEGTYNGPVERSYVQRIHFSGAINPGMSGGPTVTAEGRIAGINVAKQLGGELVSFLVPARFAAALLRRAAEATQAPADLRAEIGRQLTVWQSGLYETADRLGFRPSVFGPYEAPESAAPWFTCWAQTNAGQFPKPRASVDTTRCNSDTQLYVASDLSTGVVSLTHSYFKSIDLNPFQFAAFLSQQNQQMIGGPARKWHTEQRCHEDFLAATPPESGPPLRAVWCARAYREFEGLYDVGVTAVTEDNSGEALLSRLSMQGISYENAIKLTHHFLEAVRWAK